MTVAQELDLDRRLLIVPPTPKDGETTRRILAEHDIVAEVCPSATACADELRRGAAAMLVTEESVAIDSGELSKVLAAQPPWSDLPVLVLTRPGADSVDVAHALQVLGNVTLLERPVRVATLLSAVRTALRARERQYQIRGHLTEQNRAELALRDADRRKDEFLATLGHELRNPLSPLLTSLHLLQRSGPSDPIVTRTVAVMQRQVEHLVRLVDDLLEVSRITRGVIAVSMELIDMRTALSAAIESTRPLVESLRHELIAELPDEPWMMNGDVVRLTQIFANLINNAAKYTDAGGHIRITTTREGDQGVVSICDDGIGMAAADLATVFDMFTQIDRSDRRTQGGLGIGLTLVRSLVTLHGGSVIARSGGIGCGSRFEVRLPLEPDQQVRRGGQAALKAIPGYRVLVVDDNQDAGDTLASLLEALQATAHTVRSGAEALEALGTFHPDVVVLDIGMPRMNGYEVARRIREAPGGKDIVLIALTGWGQDDDVQRAAHAGFDHHCVKPPNMDRLSELIARARPR